MILTLLLLAPPPADEMVLAGEGVPPAPILIPADAPPRTREAAAVLADFIARISGARPEILEGEPREIPPRAVWVGVQPAVRRLFPGADLDFRRPEETLAKTDGRHLVLAGRDRWDPARTTAKGRLAMKTGLQQEYGTANAVYTFLRDDLGVRWLWPGEEDVVPRRRLALAPFERRYAPPFRARAGMFARLALGDNKEGPDELWARFQRVQLDSLELHGGHAFGHWWERYHADHPDYFALQPDGTRRPPPDPRNAKLCESNPAVWDRWLAEVQEQLAADPTRRVFNASPNDGYDYGHCVCPECTEKDPPEGEKFIWRWMGRSEERPALSDRQVLFANTLARLLRRRFPGRELYVQLHAYGYSRPAPLRAVPDDNVIVSSVSNFHMRGDGPGDGRDTAMRQFADWSGKAKLLAWRPNLGNPAGLSWGLPDVATAQAGEDFRFVADRRGIGLFFDMFWFHWATQGPHYYALAHLAWDPRTNVSALMDDYYGRAFGPAAAGVKAYWDLLERTRMEFVAEHPSRHRAFEIPTKYTPELLAKAQSHLEGAAAALGGADPKYRRRLDFVRCGLEYTKTVVDTRAWMRKLEAGRGRDDEARARVLANWERISEMRRGFPEFAINWQAVFRLPQPGGEAKRVMGLHPDYPLTGRTLRELRRFEQE